MSSLKLSYFNGMGRLEICRLIMAEAGQEYEDHRFKDGEWATFKQGTPFGFAPVLTIDNDLVVSESGSIARYLSAKFNLNGSSLEETAQIDMIFEGLNQGFFGLPFQEKDEEVKAKKWKETVEKKIQPVFNYMEKISSTNPSSNYLVGQNISYADIALYFIGTGLDRFQEGFLNAYPNVKRLVEATAARPKIAKWVKERPQTKF